KDILCIDEITMGIMAQGLVIPGFTSLIVLLTTSVTDQVASELKNDAKCTQGTNDWVIEYINGTQHEIYATTLSRHFIGKTFLECSEIIYAKLEATLFAIGTSKSQLGILLSHSSPFQIFLNPQDYVIRGDEIGFVISDSAEITVRLAKFNETYQKPNSQPYNIGPFIKFQPAEDELLSDDGCYSSKDAINISINRSKPSRRVSLSIEESSMSPLEDKTH
ncbi:10554_t:CDS:2, partial [Scutellospora calospora]